MEVPERVIPRWCSSCSSLQSSTSTSVIQHLSQNNPLHTQAGCAAAAAASPSACLCPRKFSLRLPAAADVTEGCGPSYTPRAAAELARASATAMACASATLLRSSLHSLSTDACKARPYENDSAHGARPCCCACCCCSVWCRAIVGDEGRGHTKAEVNETHTGRVLIEESQPQWQEHCNEPSTSSVLKTFMHNDIAPD